MNEDEPLMPPEDFEEELTPEESPPETPKVPGETVKEPEVPLAGDFEVKQVTRYPEDPNERQAVREYFESHHSARIDLTDTGVGRSAVSTGHKGRGKGKKSDQ